MGVMTRHGRARGMSGKTPVIKGSMLRGGYNVLTAVTAEGEMGYAIEDGTINGERYIGFLQAIKNNLINCLISFAEIRQYKKTYKPKTSARAPSAIPAASAIRSLGTFSSTSVAPRCSMTASK